MDGTISQPRRRVDLHPFTPGVGIAILILYAAAGLILWVQIGPWETVRAVGIQGLLVAAWLWSAALILGRAPLPVSEPIHRPLAEMVGALLLLAVLVGLAANRFGGWIALPNWAYLITAFAVLGIIHAYPGKPQVLSSTAESLGLTWPSRQAWLAVLAVNALNILAGIVFQVVPDEPSPVAAAGDLAQQMTGPLVVLGLLASLLFRAALPEELLFRVTLQPRLACFVPAGYAILIQAALFSLAHLPQKLIAYQYPLPLALAYTMILDNGLIAGYLYWRTRSLPLLLALHLLAFPRLGL